MVAGHGMATGWKGRYTTSLMDHFAQGRLDGDKLSETVKLTLQNLGNTSGVSAGMGSTANTKGTLAYAGATNLNYDLGFNLLGTGGAELDTVNSGVTLTIPSSVPSRGATGCSATSAGFSRPSVKLTSASTAVLCLSTPGARTSESASALRAPATSRSTAAL